MCVLILAAFVSPVLGTGVLGTMSDVAGTLLMAPVNLVTGIASYVGYGAAESTDEVETPDPPKLNWSKFQICDIRGSVATMLGPLIKHYGLLRLNELDEVLKKVTNQVLKLVETEILNEDMIAPLADLFMTWVDALPDDQRTVFFKNAVIPNVYRFGSKWAKFWMRGRTGCWKMVHKKTAKRIKKKIHEYHEIAVNKLKLQRSQPIQYQLRNMQSSSSSSYCVSSDSVALGSEETRSTPSLSAMLKIDWLDSYEGIDEKIQYEDIIEDIDGSMRGMLEVVKEFYSIEDVNFDLGNFWTKVLRNLLEPVVGIERYRRFHSCQECDGDGVRVSSILRRNKKCEKCDGTGSHARNGVTRTRECKMALTREHSILCRIRDRTVPIFMRWFDEKLPEDQKDQVVTTILGNVELTRIQSAGLKGAGLLSSNLKRYFLKKGINDRITSKIKEYVAILEPQVWKLRSDAKHL